MEDSRIGGIPGLQSVDSFPKKHEVTAGKIIGIILLTSGGIGIVAGAVFAGIYGNSNFANAFQAANLTGTLTGRITIAALFSGSTLTLIIGTVEICTTRPKDVRRIQHFPDQSPSPPLPVNLSIAAEPGYPLHNRSTLQSRLLNLTRSLLSFRNL